MLYDAQGKQIPEDQPPPAGRLVHAEPSDRYTSDVSRNLVPETIDRILRAAAQGDAADQARLAIEIQEKNWDIYQALQTRRLAVAGLPWEILPAADTPLAKRIAADVETVLRSPNYEPQDDDIQTFDQAMAYELMGALLPGFSMTEIIWGKGGKTIDGFAGIPQDHFTFLNSQTPLLITRDAPQGIPLPRAKFIYHRYYARSGDATRGGLIRPLAWLHCFQTLAGVKDLLRFVERYGMPFLVARVNQQAWEKDRNRIKYLIQNFGSDGGAVFTDAVQTELLQASNTGGDIYFRLLEYFGAAITKVILGQTATSGDAAGLSKGQAQENVRQDLLAADAAAIDATITTRLIRLWVQYNHGPGAPVPRIHHQAEAAEDLKLASEVLVNLSNAGFQADEAEVSDRFGFKLTRKPSAPTSSPLPTPSGSLLPAAAAGADALAADALPGGPEGRSSSGRGPGTASPSSDAVAASALIEFLDGNGLQDWFGPLQIALSAALRGEPDETEFRRRLQKLLDAIPDLMQQMDSTAFEDCLSRAIYTSAADGIATAAARLK